MVDERKQHLELVAASLTQAYYSVRVGTTADHRDVFETYKFLLDALIEQDDLPAGHTPLQTAESLLGDENERGRD
jgi:hypothetical protein